MKAHTAWQIDFKRDIPIQVFSLFLKAVQRARCAEGSLCIWRVLHRIKKSNFCSVHREEGSHQGLVGLEPNYS